MRREKHLSTMLCVDTAWFVHQRAHVWNSAKQQPADPSSINKESTTCDKKTLFLDSIVLVRTQKQIYKPKNLCWKKKKSISRYLNHQLSVLVSVLESYIGRALDSMDIKKNGAQILRLVQTRTFSDTSRFCK